MRWWLLCRHGWRKKEGGGNWAVHAFLRSMTANQLCQAGTPIPTEFLQAGIPALHKSLLSYYTSTKKGFPGLLSEQSRRWTSRSSCLLLMRNHTPCEASILAELRLWDARSQEHGNPHRQVSDLTIQQTHLLAWHSPSRKSEVSCFLDPSEFHREQVRKLPPTGALFCTLRRALAMTSQLCRNQECWKNAGA